MEVDLFGIVANPGALNTQTKRHLKIRSKEVIAEDIREREKQDEEGEYVDPRPIVDSRPIVEPKKNEMEMFANFEEQFRKLSLAPSLPPLPEEDQRSEDGYKTLQSPKIVPQSPSVRSERSARSEAPPPSEHSVHSVHSAPAAQFSSFHASSSQVVHGASSRNYASERDHNEDLRLENQAADLQLRRLEREGIVLSRQFRPEDPLVDKLFEIESHAKGKEMVEWLNNVRDMIAMGATGLDVANDLLGPVLKLKNEKTTWVGDFMSTTLDKLTEPLKKVYTKYVRKNDQNPFFQILFIVAGSLVMFHFREVIREKSDGSVQTSTQSILPPHLTYHGVLPNGKTNVAPETSTPSSSIPPSTTTQSDLPPAAVSVAPRPMMEDP